MAEVQPSRMRGALEIATAVLLGLVSVATAAGAYQASEWGQQAGRYESIAGQLRDASLASYIASDLAGFDDGERLIDALVLEFPIMTGDATPARVERIREEQYALLGAATAGLHDEWLEWVASGYDEAEFPVRSPEYAAQQFAPTYGPNAASAVAFELAEAVEARSLQMTIASVVFAIALLLLGVSGANATLKVSFVLACGGAAAFIVGVVVSALAVIG